MRWIIQGKLIVASPMAIRTGVEELSWPSGLEEDKVTSYLQPVDGALPPVTGIELDATSLPFITATSIKSLLRAQLARAGGPIDREQVKLLFGMGPEEIPEQGDGTKAGHGGCAMYLGKRLTSP